LLLIALSLRIKEPVYLFPEVLGANMPLPLS
jgi:hypothetical protein